MLSRLDEATRQQLEAQLECPRCHARNERRAINVHLESDSVATCANCGKYGPVQDFRKDSAA